jgi:aminoglycoside phosphotransferase (APT) family kinase protein
VTVSRHDSGKLAQSLLPWLQARLPDAESIVIPPLRSPQAGGSSDTLFFEPVIRQGGQEIRKDWVLRIEATAHQIYEDPSVLRQFRVMEALASSRAVPVPQVLWYEEDRSLLGAPFFVMQRVEGVIPDALYHSSGMLPDLAPDRREKLWLSALQTMSRIHTADASAFGFLARPSLGDTGLDQEVAVWDSYMRWSGAPVRPVQERARRWLSDHLPERRATGLAWGDARPGNLVFRDDECVAVLDWETASLGGAETDLGWWLFYDWLVSDGFGIARLPGLCGRAETVPLWERFSGRKALDMEWHEVFATWRFSLISDRAHHLAHLSGRQNAVAADRGSSPHARRLEMLIGT